jgi:hypothetical protein
MKQIDCLEYKLTILQIHNKYNNIEKKELTTYGLEKTLHSISDKK